MAEIKLEDNEMRHRLKMAYQAFYFFCVADKEEIENLGWRIGEKSDLSFGEDLFEDIIKPLIKGIEDGSGKSIRDEAREWLKQS